jgi:hypothetical protein
MKQSIVIASFFFIAWRRCIAHAKQARPAEINEPFRNFYLTNAKKYVIIKEKQWRKML